MSTSVPAAMPAGATAVTVKLSLTMNEAAATVPKSTPLAPAPKFDPVIVTEVPAGPLDGLTVAICG